VNNMSERWEPIGDKEYLKFERVGNKRSTRPDLHAFLMLNRLFPRDRDIVCAATHDVIYLDAQGDELRELTDEQIVELSRCGVMYNSEYDCLYMFA